MSAELLVPDLPVCVAAEYESECSECGEQIAVGTEVARLNHRWVHRDCWHKI